jgi:TolB-like protein
MIAYRLRGLRAASLVLLTLLGGCAYMANGETEDADLLAANYAAAEKLIAGSQVPLSKGANLVAATFVNIIDLEDSAALGKLISEQISSRLTQLGYRMVELKLRNNIFIRERAGEFMLSRNVQDISAAHDAQAVIVGTYAVARDRVFVRASVVHPASNTVVSSYDYELPIGKNLRALMFTRRQ